MSSPSNGKRYSTLNGVQSAKRKTTDMEQIASSNQMKITDLNPDCLEHIFKYLHIKDLLNVADSRKSLKDAVDQAFTSKYDGNSISILLKPTIITAINIKLKNGHQEEAETFSCILKFLRGFGKLITALSIEFSFSMHLNQQIRITELRHYINEYCIETLTELKIDSYERGTLPLSKPFVNLKKLVLYNKSVDEFIDLNRSFPKLDCLHLKFISKFNRECFEVHIPHLKEFLIVIRDMTFATNFLRLNPQIKFLKFYAVTKSEDPSILEFINEYLQLKELHVFFWEMNRSWMGWIQVFMKQHTSLDKMTIQCWKIDFMKMTKGATDEIEILDILLPDLNGWRLSTSIKCRNCWIDLVRTNI